MVASCAETAALPLRVVGWGIDVILKHRDGSPEQAGLLMWMTAESMSFRE
jgi:hypothetical protein